MKKLYRSCLIFFILSYVPFFNQVSLLLNGVFFLNIVLSFWQQEEDRKIPQVIRVGLMLMGLALIFNEFQTLWGLEPGVAILSLMGTLKIFEINSKRDFFLFVLIVELSLVGHVLTVDQLFMVLYVVFISLALFGLLFTYQAGTEARKWTKERRKVFGQIFLTSLPLAFGLFFLFPRLTLGNLFFNTVKKENLTGFADEIRPGTISEVVQNRNPYFRAKFLNDKTPSYFELYWRGSILSKTDGFIWKRVKPPGKEKEIFKKGVRYEYELSYDVFMNSPLFFLENTNEFKKLTRGHILNTGARTYKFFPYSNQKTVFSGKTSKVRSAVLFDELKDHYLQLPPLENRRRFTEWVNSLIFNKKSLRNYANTFSEYIKEKGFIYTLRPGKLSGKGALDQFFFNSRRGFCEHYSSAFAMYLRLLGVPSRVVVGFHGGEYNPLGKYYVVRGLDAHAWVEAWRPKKGWQRFDPTGFVAPDRIRYGSASYFVEQEDRQGVSLDVYLEKRSNEFWQGLLFAIDMIYYEANREFVGFDLDRQKNLFSFLGTEGKRWPWKLILISLLFSFVIIIPLLWHIKKGLEKKDPFLQVYHLLLKKIEKSGHQRPEWFGPLKSSEWCQDLFPNQRKELERAFGLFMEGFYGNSQHNREEILRQFRSVVKKLNLPKVDQKSINA